MINKNQRKLTKLEKPYEYTSKNGTVHLYDYALTLDCGHVRYLKHSGSENFLTGNWLKEERMLCKRCTKAIQRLNDMIEDAENNSFTDWSY